LLNHRIPQYIPPVINISALNKTGIEDVWNSITEFIEMTKKSGFFDKNRESQIIEWFDSLLHEAVFTKLFSDSFNQKLINDTKNQVINLELSPVLAVRNLIHKFFS